MNYDIICKECVQCRGKDIRIEVIKSNSNNNSEIVVYKCVNYVYKGIKMLSEDI